MGPANDGGPSVLSANEHAPLDYKRQYLHAPHYHKQCPTPLRGFINTKQDGKSRLVLIMRDLVNSVGTRIRGYKGYLHIPTLL